MDVNRRRQPLTEDPIMKLVNILAMVIECVPFLVVVCFAF